MKITIEDAIRFNKFCIKYNTKFSVEDYWRSNTENYAMINRNDLMVIVQVMLDNDILRKFTINYKNSEILVSFIYVNDTVVHRSLPDKRENKIIYESIVKILDKIGD